MSIFSRLCRRRSPSQLARSSLANQCQIGSESFEWPAPYLLTLEIIEAMNGPCKDFAIVLLETGARPVEILAATAGQSHPNGQIFIKAAKGSQDRIAFSAHFRSLLPRECCDKLFRPFRHLTYRKFYRAVMATGKLIPSNDSTHCPVSRLFRYAHASIANKLSDGSVSVVAHTLGHKNTKNAAYYLPQKG